LNTYIGGQVLSAIGDFMAIVSKGSGGSIKFTGTGGSLSITSSGGGGGGGGGGEPTILPGGYTMTYYESTITNAGGTTLSHSMFDGMTINQNATTYPYGSITPSGGTWYYIIWRPVDNSFMDGDSFNVNRELSPASIYASGPNQAHEIWIGDESMFLEWYAYWEDNGQIMPTSPAPYIKVYWNLSV
jgi:hypothetical protein